MLYRIGFGSAFDSLLKVYFIFHFRIRQRTFRLQTQPRLISTKAELSPVRHLQVFRRQVAGKLVGLEPVVTPFEDPKVVRLFWTLVEVAVTI